jgi:hypothetical protein
MSAEPVTPPATAAIDTTLGRIEYSPALSVGQVLDVLRALTNGVALWRQLKLANLDVDLTWVLPLRFPDITRLYGLPVRYADVPAPMLAHDVAPFP